MLLFLVVVNYEAHSTLQLVLKNTSKFEAMSVTS